MLGCHPLPHALAGPSGPHSAIARTLSFHTRILGGGVLWRPLTQAYVPKIIMTTCIYGCVRARGKFIELLVRFTSTTPKLHLEERKEFYRDTGVFPSGDATAVPWRTRRPLVGLGMEPLTKLVNVCTVLARLYAPPFCIVVRRKRRGGRLIEVCTNAPNLRPPPHAKRFPGNSLYCTAHAESVVCHKITIIIVHNSQTRDGRIVGHVPQNWQDFLHLFSDENLHGKHPTHRGKRPLPPVLKRRRVSTHRRFARNHVPG